MRWLIVGGKGMLGTDLAQLLRDRKESVKVLDRPEIDITNVKSVTEQINDTCLLYTSDAADDLLTV